ncbi:MAG: chemotaxis protein CheB [Kineosporiaceae bacterium]
MSPAPPPRAVELVVVGGSWGGLDAACALLDELPAPLPVPVLLVLHRARSSSAHILRQAVHRCSGQDLVEVGDQNRLQPGAVHLAPPDYHVLVAEAEGDVSFSLSVEAPVEYSRPSIDVAFESAAQALGAGLAAVLLSGAGRDGAHGLTEVGRRGGLVLVQDPSTATRTEMPAAGLSAWRPDAVADPRVLGRRLRAVLPSPAPAAAPARPHPDERLP